jgi:hypothetical protein
MLTFGDFLDREQCDVSLDRRVRRTVARKWTEMWPDENLVELYDDDDDGGPPTACIPFPQNTVLVAQESEA